MLGNGHDKHQFNIFDMTDFFLYEGGVYPEGLSVDFWHYPMDAHPWTDGLHNGVHICEKLRRSQKTTVDSQLK